MENHISWGKDLAEDQKIYRYLSFESFVYLIELKKLTFSKISNWDDPWENVLARQCSFLSNGKEMNSYSDSLDLYGQCWTLNAESDAMWRIYSPNKSGVQVETTVGCLQHLIGYRRLFVDRVQYCKDPKDFLEKQKTIKLKCSEALLKRDAFRHEEELRILVNPCDLEIPVSTDNPHINLDVNIEKFITGVQIDSRAPTWIEDMIISYCNKSLPYLEVHKSNLYEKMKGHFVKEYVLPQKVKAN